MSITGFETADHIAYGFWLARHADGCDVEWLEFSEYVQKALENAGPVYDVQQWCAVNLHRFFDVNIILKGN